MPEDGAWYRHNPSSRNVNQPSTHTGFANSSSELAGLTAAQAIFIRYLLFL
jgi:hypothetical protein